MLGRLAPSPTGALHLGNARSFLAAWLSARSQGGTLILRIEDIDSPRVKPWAVDATIADLQWLGLDWDSDDSIGSVSCSGASFGAYTIQSQRLDFYQTFLSKLIDEQKVYACSCSRSDVAAAASAPHESPTKALDGIVYPGTCRSKALQPSQQEKFCWRWRLDEAQDRFTDGYRADTRISPKRQLGDFVVAKQDGTPAYQLAVVIDDHAMGVDEVVRGDDLIYSTFRQRDIYRHFGWQIPKYFHLPLIVGPDGKRLAKRHGDTRLAHFKEQSITPQQVTGFLAWTLGLIDRPKTVTPQDLVPLFSWDKLEVQATVFDLAQDLDRLRKIT